jgi:AAA domain
LRCIPKFKLDIGLDNKEKPIQYTYKIFLGVFHQRYILEFLQELPKPVNPSFNDLASPKDDLSCFFSFDLDPEGFLMEESLNSSALPWALKNVETSFKNQKNLSLTNWTRSYKIYEDCLKSEFNSISKTSKRVTSNELTSILKILLNIDNVWVPDKFEYLGHYIVRRNKEKAEEVTDILNSFYLSDLEKAAQHIEQGTSGKALNNYISPHESIKRIDVEKSINLHSILSPKKIPLGRWLIDADKSLSLMQQCAVNLILSNFSEKKGLFSVNGPPGTGKTTLLRDLIADIIVQRSERLVEINNPETSFIKKDSVYKPRNSILNFEMVIASSNNNAVQNVTAELPLKKSIDSEYREKIDYFKNVAESIRINTKEIDRRKNNFQDQNKEIDQNKKNEEFFENRENEDDTSWGLISAVLGNKENCSRFCSGFWYSKDNSIRSALYCTDKSKYLVDEKHKTILLKQEWKAIREKFIQCKEKIELVKIKKQHLFENLEKKSKIEEDILRLNSDLKLVKQKINDCNEVLTNSLVKYTLKGQLKEDICTRINELNKTNIYLITRILSPIFFLGL